VNDKTYKVYCLFDGSRITATSHSDYVSQLRDIGMFVCNQGITEYMEGFAYRLGIYCGVNKLNLINKIDCSSVNSFIESLIANRFLTIDELVLQ
jgi:hypothetical protein